MLTTANSLTNLDDFVATAQRLIARRATGIYNVVNEGTISPFEVMKRYREMVEPDHVFEPLELDHLGEVTRVGRSNCLLSTAKLRGEGLELPPVSEAVDLALRTLAGRLR